MSKADVNQEMRCASLFRDVGSDFEWLHGPFTLGKYANGRAVVGLDGEKYVIVDFRKFHEVDLVERVCIVKRGINARLVDLLASSMKISTAKLSSILGFAKTSIRRKSRQQAALSSAESSRIMGMGKLIGQVQVMVEESSETGEMDPAAWIGHWLDQPLPALGGVCPRDFMDSTEGQAIVSQLLGRMQSGAYT